MASAFQQRATVEAVRAALGEPRIEILHGRPDRPAPEWQSVDPLGLVYKAGTGDLVAYSRTREQYRTFRLDRIHEIVMVEDLIEPRPDSICERIGRPRGPGLRLRHPAPNTHSPLAPGGSLAG